MSTFFNNLESYGLFLIYKMLIWTSRNIPNVGLFSAYAEVFPPEGRADREGLPFLCLRRGVSITENGIKARMLFSLPTQRCFCRRVRSQERSALFSAYAEVFPVDTENALIIDAFLCLRRGVSINKHNLTLPVAFSLPTQRCFRRPGGYG